MGVDGSARTAVDAALNVNWPSVGWKGLAGMVIVRGLRLATVVDTGSPEEEAKEGCRSKGDCRGIRSGAWWEKRRILAGEDIVREMNVMWVCELGIKVGLTAHYIGG